MTNRSVQLAAPRFRVKLPDAEPFEVQAIGADLVRWDLTAARHKWPAMDRAPFLWSTFVAWSAGKRAGSVTVTWDVFLETVEAVEALTDDDDPDDVDQVGPTPAGPGSAY